jgi:hypothetical protein
LREARPQGAEARRQSRSVSSAGTLEGKQKPFNEGSKRFPVGSGTFERDLEDRNRQQRDAPIGFHNDMQTPFNRVVGTGDDLAGEVECAVSDCSRQQTQERE